MPACLWIWMNKLRDNNFLFSLAQSFFLPFTLVPTAPTLPRDNGTNGNCQHQVASLPHFRLSGEEHVFQVIFSPQVYNTARQAQPWPHTCPHPTLSYPRLAHIILSMPCTYSHIAPYWHPHTIHTSYIHLALFILQHTHRPTTHTHSVCIYIYIHIPTCHSYKHTHIYIYIHIPTCHSYNHASQNSHTYNIHPSYTLY